MYTRSALSQRSKYKNDYCMQIFMVPVRYRLNAASGGWSYGRDLA